MLRYRTQYRVSGGNVKMEYLILVLSILALGVLFECKLDDVISWLKMIYVDTQLLNGYHDNAKTVKRIRDSKKAIIRKSHVL